MNQQKFQNFRKLYPVFCYDGFNWEIFENELTIKYYFYVGSYKFEPKYIIPISERFSLTTDMMENLIFHIGLCEMISYWKATCSPTIIIKPFTLKQDQILWWKKLFYNGLGEFRYLNGINCLENDFVNFEFDSHELTKPFEMPDNNGILIPVGGGKDSAVTLELLKKADQPKFTFTLNLSTSSEKTISQADYDLKQHINARRILSPTLLKMNDEGFLNGHTPFSALLAFVATLVAALNQLKFVALSNESSANEPTIPDTNINHQYSKTLDFEKDFRAYFQSYLSPNIEYFSFLRPINEMEIAKIFSRFPQHFQTFRSCNVGSKQNKWCGKCSKCLFVWIILSPYLSVDALIRIFGKNLEEDVELMDDFKKLIGIADEKPFECIGTVDEVRESITNAYFNNNHKGYLYQYFIESKIKVELQKPLLLTPNCLPNEFLQILKDALYE